MQQDLLNKFGPCGLLCEKCFAFYKGPIHFHAEQLKNNLGEFDNYANRFSTLLNEPKFGDYPIFKEFLALLSASNCKGCRKQQCHLFSNCTVKDCYKENCYKEKRVDFCFQCADFPCNHTGFDENLEKRWLKINRKIIDLGLNNYYNEVKEKPRY